MNNEQLNHFSKSPVDLDIGRSIFHRPFRHLTTMVAGRLIPLMAEEVLPGDSVKLDLRSLVRMATPLHPTMDNLYMDVHFYFVPNRQVWTHWKEFMGENSSTYWSQPVSYTIPQVLAPQSSGDNVYNSTVKGFAKGSVGQYLGVPIKRDGSFNALPFRGYSLIWNNYYRDQNTMQPKSINFGDSATQGSNSGVNIPTNSNFIDYYNSWVQNQYYVNSGDGCAPLPVCRFHDYFSSSLISPQKGPSVLLPLGSKAPVYNDTSKDVVFSPTWLDNTSSHDPLSLANYLTVYPSNGTGIAANSPQGQMDNVNLSLMADLSQATAASVNALRNAFMLQRFYERLARGGSRYFEMVRSFFGVTVPDLTVQIPEFLGGRRIPINITQVAQTSDTSGNTPLGYLSAYSLTTDISDSVFSKSFTEHGYLFAVCCIRAERSYSQGLPRHFSRKIFTDFYVPTFANAPEQPVYNKELFLQGSSVDDQVFGYQEAWAEYRYCQNRESGEFAPDYSSSLDSYHYGDNYSSLPILSAGWMAEDANNIKRTLAVQNQDQFLCDFLFDMTWVRVMPVYSIPGLLDHH